MKYGILMLSLLFVGCHQGVDKEVTIPNVVRVYMHKPTHFTLHVLEPSSLTLKTVELVSFTKIEIVLDIKENKKMFANVVYAKDLLFGRYIRSAVIHIRSEKDINGAGWETPGGYLGSGGESGTTQVVR